MNVDESRPSVVSDVLTSGLTEMPRRPREPREAITTKSQLFLFAASMMAWYRCSTLTQTTSQFLHPVEAFYGHMPCLLGMGPLHIWNPHRVERKHLNGIVTVMALALVPTAFASHIP
jgi:hypothetical protein